MKPNRRLDFTKGPPSPKFHAVSTVCGRYQRDWLYAYQRGKCAICRKLCAPFDLYLDHDHRNGFIRAMLCNGCNIDVACYEQPTRVQLRKAVRARVRRYVEAWRVAHPVP